MIRVLLVDDQAMVRSGFAMLVDAQEDLEVAGEAADGREAVRRAVELRPDVILMDIRMPVLDGIEATRQVLRESPRSRVLVLTTFDLDAYVYEALRAGASGFLLKDAPRDHLLHAIRVVAAGDELLDGAVTRRLIADFVRRPAPADGPPARLGELTERELEVLVLVARGMSNLEIAGQLYLGEATIKSHVRSMLRKLDLRDRTQAVIVAYESGLVVPGGD